MVFTSVAKKQRLERAVERVGDEIEATSIDAGVASSSGVEVEPEDIGDAAFKTLEAARANLILEDDERQEFFKTSVIGG
eukprot:3884456-Amphidinium_carterae.1